MFYQVIGDLNLHHILDLRPFISAFFSFPYIFMDGVIRTADQTHCRTQPFICGLFLGSTLCSDISWL